MRDGSNREAKKTSICRLFRRSGVSVKGCQPRVAFSDHRFAGDCTPHGIRTGTSLPTKTPPHAADESSDSDESHRDRAAISRSQKAAHGRCGLSIVVRRWLIRRWSRGTTPHRMRSHAGQRRASRSIVGRAVQPCSPLRPALAGALSPGRCAAAWRPARCRLGSGARRRGRLLGAPASSTELLRCSLGLLRQRGLFRRRGLGRLLGATSWRPSSRGLLRLFRGLLRGLLGRLLRGFLRRLLGRFSSRSSSPSEAFLAFLSFLLFFFFAFAILILLLPPINVHRATADSSARSLRAQATVICHSILAEDRRSPNREAQSCVRQELTCRRQSEPCIRYCPPRSCPA